ncbi:MAG: Ig-like domain-containing protein [Armatimonadota bacterium]
MRWRHCWYGLLAVLVLVGVLAGCGGHRRRGSLSLLLYWPLVVFSSTETPPLAGMRSLVIDVRQANQHIGSWTLNRPAEGAVTQQLQEQIPAGTYQYTARAYAGADGAGKMLASAEGVVTISSGQTTTITLTTVADPRAKFALLPESPTIHPGERIAFHASLVNPDQSMVLLQLNWNSELPTIAEISKEGTVQGMSAGTCIITAHDLVSDKRASIRVEVVK